MTAVGKEDLEPDSIVAGYRVEYELGRGAMAVVYRAIQLNLDRPVALKILTEKLARDEEFVGRFFNEARAAAALSQPHIVQAFDAGIAEGDIYYFVMEYVEGETLLQRLNRLGAFATSETIAIGIDIADALNYGWQRQQLTHGDIKPENIMINRDEEVKLADFGLAKVRGHEFSGSQMMLTPLYAAPELISGAKKSADCQSDIYSFGATLYHLITGEPPFPGTDPKDVMRRQVHEELTPVKERNPAVPKEVSDFIGRLLEKDPKARPADWDSVRSYLSQLHRTYKIFRKQKSIVANNPYLERPSSSEKEEHVGSPLKIILFFCAALGLIAAGFWFFYSRDGSESSQNVQKETVVKVAIEDQGQDAWEKLKDRLRETENPAHAVAMLESFQKEYPDNVPPELDKQMENYRLLIRQDAKRTVQKPDPSEFSEPDTTVSKPSTSSSNPDVEVKKSENVLENSGPAEVVQPDLATVRGRSAIIKHLLAAQEDAPALQGKDDYLLFLQEMISFKYDFNVDMQNLLEKAEDWLKAHPEDSDEQKMVQFVAEKFLPNLKNFLPTLIRQQDQIKGKTLPGRKFAGQISELNVGYIEMAETTPHGKLVRKVPWQELNHPGYLVYLALQASQGTEQEIETKRPFLALLLITGAFKFWDQAIGAVPDSAEKRLWLRLEKELQDAGEEVKALQLWQQLQQLFISGELQRTHRLIKKLSSSRTAVAYRYRHILAALQEQLAPELPVSKAQLLLEKAAGQVTEFPASAFYTTLAIQNRHGQLESPFNQRLLEIRKNALTELQQRHGREVPDSFMKWARNFVLLPSRPAWMAAVMHENISTSFSENTKWERQVTDDVVSYLSGAALLQSGNWNDAAKLLTFQSEDDLLDLPPVLKTVLWSQRALLADRLEEKEMTAELALRHAKASLVDVPLGRERVLLSAILLETAILTGSRFKPGDLYDWQTAEQDNFSKDVHEKLILNEISMSLFNNERKKAALLANELASKNVPFVQELRRIRSETWEPQEQEMYQRMTDQELRCWTVAFLKAPNSAVPPFPAEKELLAMTRNLHFLGGQALFDWCSAQVAEFLARSEIQEGLHLVERVINISHPSLSPFYAQLCFLQSGLLALEGNHGSALDVLANVNWSGSAAPSEKDCARIITALFSTVKSSSETLPEGFWYKFLNDCFRSSELDGAVDEHLREQTSEFTVSLVSGRLENALQRHFRKRAGKAMEAEL